MELPLEGNKWPDVTSHAGQMAQDCGGPAFTHTVSAGLGSYREVGTSVYRGNVECPNMGRGAGPGFLGDPGYATGPEVPEAHPICYPQ